MSIANFPVQAAQWNDLNGIYAVTPENYLDPAEDELPDSHYRIQLSGSSAKDLYNSIKSVPVNDECTGELSKNTGNIQCLFYKTENSYECHFSINIATQEIEYGVAC